jgi:hypothetical protein
VLREVEERDAWGQYGRGREVLKDVRVSHAVYQRLTAVGRPVVEERLRVPYGLEEDERDTDRMGGGTGAVLVEDIDAHVHRNIEAGREVNNEVRHEWCPSTYAF